MKFKRYFPPYLEGFEEKEIELLSREHLNNLYPIKTFLELHPDELSRIYYDEKSKMIFSHLDGSPLPLAYLSATEPEIDLLGLIRQSINVDS